MSKPGTTVKPRAQGKEKALLDAKYAVFVRPASLIARADPVSLSRSTASCDGASRRPLPCQTRRCNRIGDLDTLARQRSSGACAPRAVTLAISSALCPRQTAPSPPVAAASLALSRPSIIAR